MDSTSAAPRLSRSKSLACQETYNCTQISREYWSSGNSNCESAVGIEVSETSGCLAHMFIVFQEPSRPRPPSQCRPPPPHRPLLQALRPVRVEVEEVQQALLYFSSLLWGSVLSSPTYGMSHSVPQEILHAASRSNCHFFAR